MTSAASSRLRGASGRNVPSGKPVMYPAAATAATACRAHASIDDASANDTPEPPLRCKARASQVANASRVTDALGAKLDADSPASTSARYPGPIHGQYQSEDVTSSNGV